MARARYQARSIASLDIRVRPASPLYGFKCASMECLELKHSIEHLIAIKTSFSGINRQNSQNSTSYIVAHDPQMRIWYLPWAYAIMIERKSQCHANKLKIDKMTPWLYKKMQTKCFTNHHQSSRLVQQHELYHWQEIDLCQRHFQPRGM